MKRKGVFVAVALGLLMLAASAVAAVVQNNDVRVTVLGQLAPYRLPRDAAAPVTVFVSGHVEAAKGGTPPQLTRMEIEVNRHGILQSKGLPVCQVSQIKTATTRKALSTCSSALIGSGRFWGHIVLADQTPYPTKGRLLIFNGREGPRPLLLAHIFTSNPFPSSFVVSFAISKIAQGPYGTLLTATLPQALGDWGYVDRIKLNLRRTYTFAGHRQSYFSASCPAPRGTNRIPFPLARTRFYFGGENALQTTVVKSCGVRA
jgi:hypothetical protein